MDQKVWAEVLRVEMKEYNRRDCTVWKDNGIVRCYKSVNFPWTCRYCSRKQLDTLYTCETHCAAAKHQKALVNLGLSPPLPLWSAVRVDGPAHHRTDLMEEGSSSSGGASSQAAWPGSDTSAADSRDRPSAAPADARMCTVTFADVLLNNVPIGPATLVMSASCPWAPPPGRSRVLDGVSITGEFRPADGSTVHGSSPFTSLPPSRIEGSGVNGSSSSRPPETGAGLATGANSSTLASAVQVVIVAVRQARRPPSPRPIDVAQQGVRPEGATTGCANLWQTEDRRLGDWGADSISAASNRSESADSLGR